MAGKFNLRDLTATLRRSLKNEDGNATIEAVLWLPFFLAAFTLVMDATMIFHNQSYILRVVQDTNRGVSIGKFQSESEAEEYIVAALNGVC